MKKIAGIYNYCDRWCERCTFTSRCAVYEDETGLSPEELDMSNKAFWDRIGENFAKEMDDVIANGNGTNRPEGIFTASGLGSARFFQDLSGFENTSRVWLTGERWV